MSYETQTKVSGGTVAKILKKNKLKPHKITYYLERRDPKFTEKMDIVLAFYKEVNARKKIFKDDPKQSQDTVFISYDEKPGIQALKNKAPDLVTVGMAVTHHPPYSSLHAQLAHKAPTLGPNTNAVHLFEPANRRSPAIHADPGRFSIARQGPLRTFSTPAGTGKVGGKPPNH